jgi:hypothetical protein
MLDAVDRDRRCALEGEGELNALVLMDRKSVGLLARGLPIAPG